MGYQRRVREIESGYSDFDELTGEDYAKNHADVSVAFIAVLQLLFGAFMIGLAFWVLR